MDKFKAIEQQLQAKIDASVLRIYNQIKADPNRLKNALDAMCKEESHDDTKFAFESAMGKIVETPSQNRVDNHKKFENLANFDCSKFIDVDNSVKDKFSKKEENELFDELVEFLDKIGDKIKIEVFWD